ncbi:MAG TPA: fatty acid desaturase CarF family protein [Candidatus Baltobacteraceae bacterium]|nr:fatty acid desaturase CarF family protein [Candidatus Baltobacteraceae bacterium]
MDILLAAVSYAACAFGALLAADFLTGVLHWAEDTWLAPGQSPLLDRWVTNDNIEHHRSPGKIRAGHYWSTNRVCIALAAGATLVFAVAGVRAWEAYLVLALLSQSNQIHLWAHTSRPPRVVGWLQKTGLLQSAKIHARHHKNPYASHFCTITAFLNPMLDRTGFWRGLESIAVRLGANVHRATPARNGY